jgi:hypothetical protein
VTGEAFYFNKLLISQMFLFSALISYPISEENITISKSKQYFRVSVMVTGNEEK